MIRLSQRAWNNVLIFTMLLLILLFSTSGDFIDDDYQQDPDQSYPLVPENTLIMSFQFTGARVERIGQGWRVVGLKQGQSSEDQDLSKLADNWLQAKMKLTETELEQEPHVVVLWLAGQHEGRVYQFRQDDTKVIVTVDKQSYELVDTRLSQLILAALL